MLKDLRRVWVEDQYKVLGPMGKKSVLIGREKGGHLVLYLRCRETGAKKWLGTSNRKHRSFRRREDVLTGYESPLLANLDRTHRFRHFELSTGAEAFLLCPPVVKGWMVSLHGGPESREGREIRYGGLYRDLLGLGIAVIVLNYRGSTGLRRGVSRSAWGRWKPAILEDYHALRRKLPAKIRRHPPLFFGGSFGGALALTLAKEIPSQGCVVLAPLLDLKTQRRRGGRPFAEWFGRRFSSQDEADLSYGEMTAGQRGPVHLIFGSRDEVLGVSLFRRLKKDPPTAWSVREHNGGHAPSSYGESKRRFNSAFASIRALLRVE